MRSAVFCSRSKSQRSGPHQPFPLGCVFRREGRDPAAGGGETPIIAIAPALEAGEGAPGAAIPAEVALAARFGNLVIFEHDGTFRAFTDRADAR